MSRTSSGIAISGSSLTSCMISSIGKSGARSSGPTGSPVPGCSTGCGGFGMSARDVVPAPRELRLVEQVLRLLHAWSIVVDEHMFAYHRRRAARLRLRRPARGAARGARGAGGGLGRRALALRPPLRLGGARALAPRRPRHRRCPGALDRSGGRACAPRGRSAAGGRRLCRLRPRDDRARPRRAYL